MEKRNEGRSNVDIMQNQFTAYVQNALRNNRNKYRNDIRKKAMMQLSELYDATEMVNDDVLTFEETEVLFETLKKIQERERKIVYLRAVKEKSFGEIAAELGMKYSNVSMVYYRAIEKLRRLLIYDEL